MAKRPIIQCERAARKEEHEVHIFEFEQKDTYPMVGKACCLGYKEVDSDDS